jgi:hypothetical protein
MEDDMATATLAEGQLTTTTLTTKDGTPIKY